MQTTCQYAGCNINEGLIRIRTAGGHYLRCCSWHAMTHDVTKTMRAKRVETALMLARTRTAPTVTDESGDL